jgi:hypothetical protein
MENKIVNYVKEMTQILNDDALFHQREIPGDADDFESRSQTDPGEARHALYVCINELIDLYDQIEESEYDAQMSDKIIDLMEVIEALKMKM